MAYSVRSGQALYRWKINRLLDGTTLGLHLADDGDDAGRMVRTTPSEITALVNDVLSGTAFDLHKDVTHAVALFRSRGGTREDRRSAIVALAGILERRRPDLHTHLSRKDEAALFEIANSYDLRHRNATQLSDYGDEFLERIFYWYLATVRLCDQLTQRAQ